MLAAARQMATIFFRLGVPNTFFSCTIFKINYNNKSQFSIIATNG